MPAQSKPSNNSSVFKTLLVLFAASVTAKSSVDNWSTCTGEGERWISKPFDFRKGLVECVFGLHGNVTEEANYCVSSKDDGKVEPDYGTLPVGPSQINFTGDSQAASIGVIYQTKGALYTAHCDQNTTSVLRGSATPV
ncbi:MAG: hypothetical protein K0R66_1095 [Gammaproteobacteria bacterium]|jgi:hypothetical protein|nr:hypothetical protein [Gammaproteobacteria bacterium]